ncbi:hypothetical protein [Photobacterium gaetbulicola]|uniref:alpha/beta hydrolase n=1 Tax=Photobacterium gaetbulicola TaxID=1295392 RepID=UPI00068C7E98|nr:hypothetical protein [Photobacterium gaetbulicola]
MEEINRGNSSTGFASKVATYFWWKGIEKIEATLDSFFDSLKIKRLIEKIITGLEDIGALRKVLGKDPIAPFYGEDSELNRKYYDSTESYIETLQKIPFDLTPLKKENTINRLPTQSVNPSDPTPNEKWFFINGICTSKDMAKINARMLSKVFGRPITPLHNPTNGMIADLTEAIEGRDLDQFTHIARTTKDLIWQELQHLEAQLANHPTDHTAPHKIVVIGHSQGGIILSNVVGRLLQEHHGDPLLNHLEIYTFASAHDDYPSFAKGEKHLAPPFTEHFANNEDYVAMIGVLSRTSNTQGKVFVKQGAGHLLNYHYLRDFLSGQYDPQGESRLSQLRNGKR